MSQWILPEASCITFLLFAALMLNACGEKALRLGMDTNVFIVALQKN